MAHEPLRPVRRAASGPRLRALQILDEDGGDVLLVDMLAGGTGFNLERSPEVAAEFIAWVTERADFPEGSVALFGWASDALTLRTNMSAAELSTLFEG